MCFSWIMYGECIIILYFFFCWLWMRTLRLYSTHFMNIKHCDTRRRYMYCITGNPVCTRLRAIFSLFGGDCLSLLKSWFFVKSCEILWDLVIFHCACDFVNACNYRVFIFHKNGCEFVKSWDKSADYPWLSQHITKKMCFLWKVVKSWDFLWGIG